jgi:hypothetical protein
LESMCNAKSDQPHIVGGFLVAGNESLTCKRESMFRE